jgi:cytochrome o ubiquinol oxidase subunit 1
LVWHIWWLAIAGLLGVVITLILRSYDNDIDYTISAETVAGMDGTPTPARTRDLQEAL